MNWFWVLLSIGLVEFLYLFLLTNLDYVSGVAIREGPRYLNLQVFISCPYGILQGFCWYSQKMSGDTHSQWY